MENPIMANTQKVPFAVAGSRMIVFGILGMVNFILNLITQILIYIFNYSETNHIYILISLASIISIINFLVIICAEVILIVGFNTTAKRTQVSIFNQLVIIHIVYLIYLFIYRFILSQVLSIFIDISSSSIETFNSIYSTASLGLFILFLLNDWCLYRLCKKIIPLNSEHRSYIIYLPFVLIAIRLSSILTNLLLSLLFGENVWTPILSLISVGISVLIPIIWMVLGRNIKSVAVFDDNAPGYLGEESRLNTYTIQSRQEQVDLNQRDTAFELNIYNTCHHCGKPRQSQTEIFCSNCGNRF